MYLSFVQCYCLSQHPSMTHQSYSIANPFETSKHRREKEVCSLLEKFPPEIIMFDPSKIGIAMKRKERPTKQGMAAEIETAVEAAKNIKFKKKTKGRSSASNQSLLLEN